MNKTPGPDSSGPDHSSPADSMGAGSRPNATNALAASPQADSYLAEVSRRDQLLLAVSTAIGELLTADPIKSALPTIVERIAEIVRVDRMLVLQVHTVGDGQTRPEVYHSWHRRDTEPVRELGEFVVASPDRDAFFEAIKPLEVGKEAHISQFNASPSLRRFLKAIGAMSMMLVPIIVRGKQWGTVSFDDCSGDLAWTRDEINSIKLFADVLGVAITRERSMLDLRSRDELLHAVTMSASAIMTAPSLNEAISESLQNVAKTVGADRIYLLEVLHSADGSMQLLHRNSWHQPQVPLDLEALLGVTSRPYGDDYLTWATPLSAGKAIEGSLSKASGGLSEYFRSLKLAATLVVPIMVDGNYWGQIGLDVCASERRWSWTEIDILKMLAELIGTAIKRERYVEELANANTIVQNSPTVLYRLQGAPGFPMMYVSQNITLFGYEAGALLSSPTLFHGFVHPEDRSRVQASMVELLRPDAVPTTIEYRMLNSAGESRWVENRFTPVRDTRGRLTEVEGIIIDITERKAAEEKIALLARTDALTGLANRATFNDRLKNACSAAQRGGTSFAVLYLDLDRFKEVNDTLGHPVGDQLLQEAAGRLKRSTRESDVVARLGGDEFAVLQLNIADMSAASALGEKIIEVVGKPYQIEMNVLRIGVSVGISACAHGSGVTSPGELMAQADQALYRAKEEGRGQCRFHTSELDSEARERTTLADDLRLALGRNELEIYYQPQVELSTGRVTGMEALIRWNHSTRGLLLPDAFLPVAEKTGLVVVLGRWVLNGACRQLRLWRDEGLEIPVIAVNVALAQIRTGQEFVADVKNTLARWQLAPQDLEIDVTELILARTTLAQSSVLEELRTYGVHIAIDDFGSQYSSLDYLRTYHVSRLKIPRRMVAAAAEDRGGSAMIRAIVGLASELRVEVIAEGIETEAQRRHLIQKSDVKTGQGYLFSTPMPASDASDILRVLSAAQKDG